MKYLCLLFFILILEISAQAKIAGTVLSDNKQPLLRASIILTDTHDNIIAFVFSNKDGSFSLNTDQYGSFNLQITAAGYEKKNIPISFIKKNSVIDFNAIELSRDKVKEIKEVVITRNTPIRLKKIRLNIMCRVSPTEQNAMWKNC